MAARSTARWTLRWLALGAVAVLMGCATAPTAVFAPPASPRTEALGYFPATAPELAVVRTDPDAAPTAALAAAGLLDPLRDGARRAGVNAAQVRTLLGNELVVGRPHVGGPPLAVLVTRDEERLRTLVEARVLAFRAGPAGTYRGADLYDGRGHAFAVRGAVLLVSRTTTDLRAALDTRHDEDGYDAWRLPKGGSDVVARAIVDLRPVVARGDERARGVPLVAAADRATLVLRAGEASAVLDVRVDLAFGELVELDVPVSPGERPPRAISVPRWPTVTVRDLAHTLGVAELSLRAASPLAALRLDARRDRVRRSTGVDLAADVVRGLHGSATVVLTRRGPLLRAQMTRPRAVRRALERLEDELPRGVRVVVAGDALAAGRAPERVLRALARRPANRPAGAAGGLTFAVPASAVTRMHGLPLPARDVTGWVRGGTRRIDAQLAAPLEP